MHSCSLKGRCIRDFVVAGDKCSWPRAGARGESSGCVLLKVLARFPCRRPGWFGPLRETKKVIVNKIRIFHGSFQFKCRYRKV